MAFAVRQHHKKAHKSKPKNEQEKVQNESDHLDGLHDELKTLQFNDENSNGREQEGVDREETASDEVSGEGVNSSSNTQELVKTTEDSEVKEESEDSLVSSAETSGQTCQAQTMEEKET